MSRRAVTPSLEASQQSHIDDLVRRNRTHEQTIRNLKDELTQEKSRAKTTVQDIQHKLHAEKREWREACDTLQACHRIHHLRLQVALEKQRSDQLVEQELLRKEKVATLQREFAITKFQMQETLLERRISELEDEITEVRQLREKERQASKARISKLAAHLGMQEEQLNASEQARADLETELNELHKTNAETQVSSDSLSVKLERTTLQLDGERSKNADLERVNDEIKRSNDELKRQVAKWRSLESKGDTEMETERKKRVEIEVQLQAVQIQLGKREQDFTKAEKRTEKAKQYLDDWKSNAEVYQSELEELKKKFAKLEKVNKKLLAEVDSLKETRIAKNYLVGSEEEVAHVVSQVVPSSPAPVFVAETSKRKNASNKPSSKPLPRQIRKGIVPAASSSHSPVDVNIDIPASSRAKGKGKLLLAETESDAETEIEQPQRKTRSRPKPRSKPSSSTSDLDIEIIAPEEFKGRKGKRKASPLPAVHEQRDEGGWNMSREQSPVPVKRRKRNDYPQPPKPKLKAQGGGARGKNVRPSVAESTASTVTADPEPGGSGSQKPATTRKRKINLFPTSSKMDLATLDFGSQGSGIPSVLSPLKPEQAIPARSTSFLSLLKR
ncbi:hypothetical protein J3R30DRAFT_3483137 [Lentinula aciculospora]|uniref:Uncharacterized protein n=1 Tax=Lentinula aciculospora TaxID=153920 RepID=A0A9W9A9T5_9AGAR|nr:hypothetical protein J3R30DRAFT_3483137 [Lentinula aciculospora]